MCRASNNKFVRLVKRWLRGRSAGNSDEKSSSDDGRTRVGSRNNNKLVAGFVSRDAVDPSRRSLLDDDPRCRVSWGSSPGGVGASTGGQTPACCAGARSAGYRGEEEEVHSSCCVQSSLSSRTSAAELEGDPDGCCWPFTSSTGRSGMDQYTRTEHSPVGGAALCVDLFLFAVRNCVYYFDRCTQNAFNDDRQYYI